jgi:hypothetical protein
MATTTSPLLALPTELRLLVYDFVIPPIPLSGPPVQYTGLLYSCHLIRHELVPEILKRMTTFLYSVQARCRKVYDGDMLFEEPQSLESLHNLRVVRPMADIFTRHDPFMALIYMHFNTLTVVTLDPPPSPDFICNFRVKVQVQMNTHHLINWISSVERGGTGRLYAQKIVYEWKTNPQITSPWLNKESLKTFSMQKVWRTMPHHTDDRRYEGVEFWGSKPGRLVYGG